MNGQYLFLVWLSLIAAQLCGLEDSLFRPRVLLGRGTFGNVELVWDARSQEYVALKTFFGPTKERDAAQEFQNVQKVAHLPSVISCTRYEDRFLIMPYKGRDLYQIKMEIGRFPFAQIKAIARDLIFLLSQLEELHILHGDLKLKNLYFPETENRCYVGDWGVAQDCTQPKENTLITFYNRPTEEILKCRPHAPAMDVFSLGSILLDLYTGERPFFFLLGEDESPKDMAHLLALHEFHLGPFPLDLLRYSPFFTISDGSYEWKKTPDLSPPARTILQLLEEEKTLRLKEDHQESLEKELDLLHDLILKMLAYPDRRVHASELIKHPLLRGF